MKRLMAYIFFYITVLVVHLFDVSLNVFSHLCSTIPENLTCDYIWNIALAEFCLSNLCKIRYMQYQLDSLFQSYAFLRFSQMAIFSVWSV